jgi:hypothetical protein
MTFVKDLAMLNLNTSFLIPVKISESISGVSAKKLALVDALVVYDFKKGAPFFSGRGWRRILDFAREGGRVWIETGGESAEKESSDLPDVFPITANRYGALGEDWEVGGPLADEVDFSLFEKLDYRGTPWKLSHAPAGEIKGGAEVLLTQREYPIAVSQPVGEGQVLWTGGNFWYRPEEFRKSGLIEIRLIEALLKRLLGELGQARVDQPLVTRDKPEQVRVSGEGFSGVVFKDTHWPGWRAKVEGGGKVKTVPVLTAGPVLMYVPIPKDMQGGELKVSIDYQGDPFYWFCFFVSVAALMVVLLYLVLGDRMLGRFGLENLAKRVDEIKLKGIKEKVLGWWDRDDHEWS